MAGPLERGSTVYGNVAWCVRLCRCLRGCGIADADICRVAFLCECVDCGEWKNVLSPSADEIENQASKSFFAAEKRRFPLAHCRLDLRVRICDEAPSLLRIALL